MLMFSLKQKQQQNTNNNNKEKATLISTCLQTECWAVLVVADIPMMLLNLAAELKNAKQVTGVIYLLSSTFYGIFQL